MPGFAAIAQTAIAALEAHPDQAITIAQIALADFRQGQVLILGGDREAQRLRGDRIRGGEPSTTLQQLANIQNHSLSSSRFLEPTLVERERPDGLVQSENQPSVSPRSVRVDLERLEHLKYLTNNLLTHQNRQVSTKQELQNTLWNFREKFQQHQQHLKKVRNYSEVSQDSRTDLHISLLRKEFDGNLDALMQSVLEENAQLEEIIEQVEFVHQQWTQTMEKQQQLVTNIQEELIEAQMSPLGETFNRLQPVLQRLVVTYDKPAELKLSGAHLWVDKTVCEKLYDALLHLVRNAFDHGLESREIRQQSGKPETGQIHILAYQQGRQTVIEVKDDGRGLDFEKIRERAVQSHLLSSADAACLSDLQLSSLLFEPGFSTASQVNELSGRGIGLHIVHSQLQSLQGSITIHSAFQQGTTFVLTIPLSLTATPDLTTIFSAEQADTAELDSSATTVPPTLSLEEIWNDECILENADIIPPVFELNSTEAPANSRFLPELSLKTAQFFVWIADSIVFVLPYGCIEEHFNPKADKKIQSQNKQFLHWQEQIVRIYPLSELLHNSNLLPEITVGQATCGAMLTLIIREGQQFFALESAVSRLSTEPELLIQRLGEELASPEYLYGYTRLGNGGLVPVIDVMALLNQTTGSQGKAASSTAPLLTLPNSISMENIAISKTTTSLLVTNEATVLLVDDSATIRKLLTLTLEGAGYRVLQAQDGQEAIEQLQQNSNIKLVICDVEMPNVNGLDFLRWYRQNPLLAKAPVVMLSSWDSEEYRQMAMRWGAVTYLTKPYDEPEFLATLKTISSAVKTM